ncbi:flagellin [Aurantimonas sp. C2-6-R+9]|uniref:flagellin N-terminal helical domain-containing protein n=1 Tax=unclassified Aurantimonas TaxID=2638230 RepID=UPI002E183A52|nr:MULTISPECIES: flagellin [unclassified Aurantimonas]MEC5291019.1 flagellin [Aurantimonas sp. C2-3-R2]MEC5381348.1 flagellin [Aurantimonas sp. C2-6-R+9]MEC5412170.1 flagellin [Aurantimonas sp. C2-4-R8]
MTSINTNASAMTALQSLQMINSSLDQTQARISTGYRVGEAKDNAAYWSIATTMRSDNQAMSAVSDSLGIGAATVDTAYTGLTAAKDVLNEIKAKLTTATGEGVDKAKVQSEITALQEQLKTISDSASFSGQNWLSNTAAGTQKEIVSSLSRDSSGMLSVGSIKVDIANIRLFSANAGILDKTIDIDQFAAATGTSTVETTAVSFGNDNKISFSISQNGAAGRAVEITQATLTAAGLASSTIKSDSDLTAVYTQALKDAGIQGIDVTITAGAVSFNSLEDFTVSAATASGATPPTVASLGLAAADTAAAATGSFSTSVTAIDISTGGVTSGQVQAYIRVVDEALSQVTTAASSLGAVQNRIEMQTNFVSKLMDTISKGVGALVDADMTEESTRLKALQTQQQLGVQALSIANSSSQSLLSLFR